jgi:serine/threonine-protein kinase
MQYAEISATNGTSQTLANDDAPAVPAETSSDRGQQPWSVAQAAKHIGAQLKGKWSIETLLGVGGMAFVYSARHRNGRRVAVKVMRPELAAVPSLVERFLREGYLANKIEHPGAVAILDDDVMDDGTPFLVMELLTGKTLRQRLNDGPLELQHALKIIADVLDVLAVAHDQGIVHRDIKPENLFQTDDGSIKVLDFGIARLKVQSRTECETLGGTTLGTLGFMPPEQALGLTAEVDARSDVWAIGATLFTLLTGHLVHQARTVNESWLLAMTACVTPIASRLPSVPRSVHALLDGALAFKRSERFASARAMKEALDRALAERESPPKVSPRTVARKTSGRGVFTASVLGGVSLLAVVAFVRSSPLPAQPAVRAEITSTTSASPLPKPVEAPAPETPVMLAASATSVPVPKPVPQAKVVPKPRAVPPVVTSSSATSKTESLTAGVRDPLGVRH